MKNKEQFLEKRQIRVFISSTFKDLQKERDFLMRRTFPKLQEEALRHGVSITEVDLRWGITEEETKMEKVLQICLEEVDYSIPFFIGILGQRYGWIPTMKDINKQVLLDFPQVKAYIENNISITEMEFLYGVLENREKMNALFFVPKSHPKKEGDSIGYEKMLQLTDKVVNNGKYPVYYYDNPEEISEQVEKFFIYLLDEKFPIERKSPNEMELMSQYLHAKSLTTHFIENVDYSSIINSWLESDNSVLLVLGESGIGKSSILAKWILDNVNNNYKIIPQFIGYGGNHSSGEYVKNFLYVSLSKFVCLTENSIKKLSLDKQLQCVINHFPNDKKCVKSQLASAILHTKFEKLFFRC